MKPAVAELIRRVLVREGGVADVGDGKGVTRYGQTTQWLREWDLPVPTNETEAAENYRHWLAATKLDLLVGDEADALADAVIDLAVHSGHVVAILALQRAVGVATDGVIGPRTFAAAQVNRARAAAGVMAWRMEQQGRLIARDPDRYGRYALGWARRNAEHVKALA